MDSVWEWIIIGTVAVITVWLMLPKRRRQPGLQRKARQNRTRRHRNTLVVWLTQLARIRTMRLSKPEAHAPIDTARFIADRRAQFPQGDGITRLLEDTVRTLDTLIITALPRFEIEIAALQRERASREAALDAVSPDVKIGLAPEEADMKTLFNSRASQIWFSEEARRLRRERRRLLAGQGACAAAALLCTAIDIRLLAVAQLSDLTDPTNQQVEVAWSLAIGVIAALALCVHYGQLVPLLTGRIASLRNRPASDNAVGTDLVPSAADEPPDDAEAAHHWQRAARIAVLPILAAIVLMRLHGLGGGESPSVGAVIGVAAGAFCLALLASQFLVWLRELKDRRTVASGKLAAADEELQKCRAGVGALAVFRERHDREQAFLQRREAERRETDAKSERLLAEMVDFHRRDGTVAAHLKDTSERIALLEEETRPVLLSGGARPLL